MRSDDVFALPPDLPVPEDDGAADGLPGRPVPAVALPATEGGTVSLADPAAARTVVFVYPRMGPPDEEPPAGVAAWDAIPGARGCTPQACSFRDAFGRFHALDVRVFGLSTEPPPWQRKAVARLGLPYPLLSDERLRFASELGLPTFAHAGLTLLRRLTLVVRGGAVEHVFYPVFPPDRSAATTLAWLETNP